jgi:putative aldouronate transport system substrate-binding protein
MGLGPRFDWVYGAYGVAGVFDLSSAANFGMNVRKAAYMQATDYIRQLNEAGVIDPDWPTLKKDEFRARWKQGSCGMMHENFAALSTKSNYKAFDENFPDGQWVTLVPPKGPNGANSNGTVILSARIYAISQKAIDEGKGPAIARLLEWMANDEGYYLLGFGEKGVNYNLDADGNITLDGLPDPAKAWTTAEMQPLTQLANMVYIFTPVELNARYPSYKSVNGRTMNRSSITRASPSSPIPRRPVPPSSTRPPMRPISPASTARTSPSSSWARQAWMRTPGPPSLPASTASARRTWKRTPSNH